jgi:hypothetical protein
LKRIDMGMRFVELSLFVALSQIRNIRISTHPHHSSTPLPLMPTHDHIEISHAVHFDF